jgi:hypothetical protein
MTDKLLLPLTRALLRTSRQYDKNPSLKVLLATSRRLGYDMISADWLPNPTEVPTAPNDIAGKVCGDMTTEVCHGARLFTGDEGNGPTVQQALSGAIRAALRPPDQGGGGHEPTVLADAAFALLRRLDAGVALGERVLGPPPTPPSSGWPAVARCAPDEPLAAGDLLVSHPLLRRDVVLLLSARDDGYAFGLVTNAPTAATLGAGPMLSRGRSVGPVSQSQFTTTGSRLLEGEMAAARRVRDDDISPFAQHPILYGGPDGASNVTMLHSHGTVRQLVARVCTALWENRARSASLDDQDARGSLTHPGAPPQWLAGLPWPPGLVPELAPSRRLSPG